MPHEIHSATLSLSDWTDNKQNWNRIFVCFLSFTHNAFLFIFCRWLFLTDFCYYLVKFDFVFMYNIFCRLWIVCFSQKARTGYVACAALIPMMVDVQNGSNKCKADNENQTKKSRWNPNKSRYKLTIKPQCFQANILLSNGFVCYMKNGNFQLLKIKIGYKCWVTYPIFIFNRDTIHKWIALIDPMTVSMLSIFSLIVWISPRWVHSTEFR